ncbi:hypothetical protein JKP88DRAFT_275472 [Tribonema minus]|uniref:Uncharacterized protein n=1 Tax=Tribonema minus TaxID=303371 RepID=A0A836CLH1_9STRA|nr:hypothetical protein JKP88DRAFT_275472 [Tribonema minus]
MPGKTWGEDLQLYAAAKSQLPWNPESVPPVTYVNTYDVSRKARELDPVLGKYRDADKEAAQARKEIAKCQQLLQAGMTKQAKTQQQFDILTNASLSRAPAQQTHDDYRRQRKEPDSRTPYNIISNTEKAPGSRSAQQQSRRPNNDRTENQRAKPSRAHAIQRDFNVLSNCYVANHSARTRSEQEAALTAAKAAYARTHDFNALEGRYYDANKESAYQAAVSSLKPAQGLAQARRLPRSVVYSEGQLYDIISKKPKDPVRESEMDSVPDPGLSKRAAGRAFLERSLERRRAKEAAATAAALNRVSYKREVEASGKGFDPLTNEGYAGRCARALPRGRNRTPRKAFETLHAEAAEMKPSGAAVGGTGSGDRRRGHGGHGDSGGGGVAGDTAAATSRSAHGKIVEGGWGVVEVR